MIAALACTTSVFNSSIDNQARGTPQETGEDNSDEEKHLKSLRNHVSES